MDFTVQKIKTLIDQFKNWILIEQTPLSGFTYVQSDYQDSFVPPAADAGWLEFDSKDRMNTKDAHYWFHKKFTTPAISKAQQVIFHLTTGLEGGWDATNPQCVVILNGKMQQALDVNHNDLLLEPETEYDMYINYYTGMNDTFAEFNPSLILSDTKTEQLYYDISVPFHSAILFHKDNENRINILRMLNIAVMMLDLRYLYSKEYYESVDAALNYLDKYFYNGICKDNDIKVNCIGHTHIDVAWLWTLAQTREKAQRSFSTVLNLMKQYPEYKFMSSQPQLYKYVKEAAPALYEEIKQAVKDGRWEVDGAMWLEADCNLTSGESLIRQVLFGKRFMQQEFNVDSKTLWLPDVFGYSAAMPQILKKSGVDKFVTSKISWNETNRMPYDTFLWEGLDGTDIFTYFITAQDVESADAEAKNYSTYVGYIRPSQVLGTWKRYQPKTHNTETMLTFGFGDGGGGPTKDMLEQQRRLAKGIPGMPQTEITTADAFLDKVEKNFYEGCAMHKHTPKWVGELYLELHRGTYTSIAKIKKNNRKSEYLYQDLEAISCIGMDLLGKAYPQEIINQHWETILLNQFHDILPGSSIFEVYEDSDRQYAKILSDGKALQSDTLSSIAENIKTDGGLLVYNPHSHACSDTIDIDGTGVYAENVPAFGWKVFAKTDTASSIQITDNRMENKYYIVTFNEKGDISSIFDKKYQRQLIQSGTCANQFCVFEDYPYQHDAWELSSYYTEKMWTVDTLLGVKQLQEGARAGLELTKTYKSSTFVQKIYLYENSRRIDFVTDADWHEDHVVLKTVFPFDIHANTATYEVQFGHVSRPTHSNTSWDDAKFEVCAQKWGDLSEDDYGVSLLNDCKYGYSTKASVMSLTLLKAAAYPNPQADRGQHSFTYSLYPHAGNVVESNTTTEALKLNRPMLAKIVSKQEGSLPEQYSYLGCETKDIIIDTVKKAEDSNDIIIRLYESCNKRTNAKIQLGFDIASAAICDMMENEITAVPVDGTCITIPVKPFEIVTLKLKR